MTVLTLPIKRKYFELIKTRQKLEEYRQVKEYWSKRLRKPNITQVKLRVGYPKLETPDSTIICKFKGYTVKSIDSEVYGRSIEVYAIDVSEPIS